MPRVLLALLYGRLDSIQRHPGPRIHVIAPHLAKTLGMRQPRLRAALERAEDVGLLKYLKWYGKSVFVVELKAPEGASGLQSNERSE
jgi:hypothetical protein